MLKMYNRILLNLIYVFHSWTIFCNVHSQVPRYVRLRREHKSKHGTTCKSSSNDQLTQSTATQDETPSPPDETQLSPEKPLESPGSYNPDEYITTSQEDLCGDLFVQHCPSRRLSKTFSSPDIRRLNSPWIIKMAPAMKPEMLVSNY